MDESRRNSHGISQLGVLKNGTVWASDVPSHGSGTYLYLYDGTSWRDINTSVINVSYSSYGVKLMNTGPDDTFWACAKALSTIMRDRRGKDTGLKTPRGGGERFGAVRPRRHALGGGI